MSKLLFGLAGAMIAVVLLVLGGGQLVRSQPELVNTVIPGLIPCTVDGNHPRWVLEAYDGQDCVYNLPWWVAPPGADWTTYCTMWCEPMWPPRD